MKYSDTRIVTTASPARPGAFSSARDTISDGMVMTTRSRRTARKRDPSEAKTRGVSPAAVARLVMESAPLPNVEDVLGGLRRAALAAHDARHLPSVVCAMQRDVHEDVLHGVHELVAFRVAI